MRSFTGGSTMGFLLTHKIAISKTLCSECNNESKNQRISQANLNIVYDIPIHLDKTDAPNNEFSVKVDVQRVKWQKDNFGAYYAIAHMYVLCPKCSKPHEIEQLIEAPRIYLKQSRRCDNCGSMLSFQEEELDIEDRNGKPFITLVGKLICQKCQTVSPHTFSGKALSMGKEREISSYVIACGKGQKLFIDV